jgi:hypothetical protein
MQAFVCTLCDEVVSFERERQKITFRLTGGGRRCSIDIDGSPRHRCDSPTVRTPRPRPSRG